MSWVMEKLNHFSSLFGGYENPDRAPADSKLLDEKAELVARKLALETEYATLGVIIVPGSGASEAKCNWAHRRRSVVKKEVAFLQQKLADINAERKRRSGALVIERHFMDVCRETMDKDQFQALIEHAIERASAESKPC